MDAIDWFAVILLAGSVAMFIGAGLGYYTAACEAEREKAALAAKAWEQGHDAGLRDWREATETMERGLIPAPYSPNPYREDNPNGR